MLPLRLLQAAGRNRSFPLWSCFSFVGSTISGGVLFGGMIVRPQVPFVSLLGADGFPRWSGRLPSPPPFPPTFEEPFSRRQPVLGLDFLNGAFLLLL